MSMYIPLKKFLSTHFSYYLRMNSIEMIEEHQTPNNQFCSYVDQHYSILVMLNKYFLQINVFLFLSFCKNHYKWFVQPMCNTQWYSVLLQALKENGKQFHNHLWLYRMAHFKAVCFQLSAYMWKTKHLILKRLMNFSLWKTI